MENKEPKHREDTKGKYLLSTEFRGGKIFIQNLSFDTKEEAEAWGNWNNFGGGNEYEIVLNLPAQQ